MERVPSRRSTLRSGPEGGTETGRMSGPEAGREDRRARYIQRKRNEQITGSKGEGTRGGAQ